MQCVQDTHHIRELIDAAITSKYGTPWWAFAEATNPEGDVADIQELPAISGD